MEAIPKQQPAVSAEQRQSFDNVRVLMLWAKSALATHKNYGLKNPQLALWNWRKEWLATCVVQECYRAPWCTQLEQRQTLGKKTRVQERTKPGKDKTKGLLLNITLLNCQKNLLSWSMLSYTQPHHIRKICSSNWLLWSKFYSLWDCFPLPP